MTRRQVKYTSAVQTFLIRTEDRANQTRQIRKTTVNYTKFTEIILSAVSLLQNNVLILFYYLINLKIYQHPLNNCCYLSLFTYVYLLLQNHGSTFYYVNQSKLTFEQLPLAQLRLCTQFL